MKEIQLITIVTESVVQSRLIDDLERVGARGWTLTPAQGAGPQNRRVSEVEGGNIRVEVLADPATVDRIWQVLHELYFPNYAVSAWQSAVLVSRSDRYFTSREEGQNG